METFFSLTKKLERFWKGVGCTIVPPYDLEMGAGTFHPLSVFGPLLFEKIKFATLQPCRRPGDSMSNKSPNRFFKFHQYQVILKPFSDSIVEIFKESLSAIGFDLQKHDLQFIEGDWASPTLGAYGLGYEARLDNMEICQITYFQKMGGEAINKTTVEFAYGVERLFMKLNHVSDLNNTLYDQNLSMEKIMLGERDFFNAYKKDTFNNREIIDFYFKTIEGFIEKKHFFAAYDYALKLTHEFNILEATGGVNIHERRSLVQKIQKIFSDICSKTILMYKNKTF